MRAEMSDLPSAAERSSSSSRLVDSRWHQSAGAFVDARAFMKSCQHQVFKERGQPLVMRLGPGGGSDPVRQV